VFQKIICRQNISLNIVSGNKNNSETKAILSFKILLKIRFNFATCGGTSSKIFLKTTKQVFLINKFHTLTFKRKLLFNINFL